MSSPNHSFSKTIVDASWLNENINIPNLVILYVVDGITTEEKQVNKTIPKARYFDLSIFKDQSAKFPNTAPNAQYFSEQCRNLGINNDSIIVVFDEVGIYSSPRAWWLFNLMGHDNIAVLDGGLPSWKAHNFTTETTQNSYAQGSFTAYQNSDLLIGFDHVRDNSENQEFIIIDARSSGRFNGTDAEPRKHLKSGSIPNSVNVPFKSVLSGGKFKDKHELEAIFLEQISTLSQKDENIVFSCGSGMTACIIMMAFNIAIKDCKKVYDGSWTEWAERNHLTH